MSGKIIGYVRVSSVDQNPERQLHDVKVDKIYTDKVSGSKSDRPALNELLNYVRDGDTIIVHSMDRLARNLDDLRKIVKQLVSNKIQIKFIKENLIFNGDDSPMSNLLLSVMGAFSEFERSLIRERQAEGIAQAKKKGIYKGRTPALNEEEIAEIKNMIDLKIPKSVIAKTFNVSRHTIYNTLNRKNQHE